MYNHPLLLHLNWYGGWLLLATVFMCPLFSAAKNLSTVILTVVALSSGAWLTAWRPEGAEGAPLQRLSAALAGVLMLLAVAILMSRFGQLQLATTLFAPIGRRSLEIYLVPQSVLGARSRILLLQILHIANPVIADPRRYVGRIARTYRFGVKICDRQGWWWGISSVPLAFSGSGNRSEAADGSQTTLGLTSARGPGDSETR